MDKVEARLREDAEHIVARVPPHVAARIEASLRALPRQSAPRRPSRAPQRLAASLAGTAAVALVALLFVGERDVRNAGGPPDAGEMQSVPEYVREFERQLIWHARTAALTAPLEEELENLRSDLEKTRDNVREELGFSFRERCLQADCRPDTRSSSDF